MRGSRADRRRGRLARVALAAALALVGLALVARGAGASNAAVGLSDASRDALSVPRWLYIATGGATIGASALLASFVTDRAFVRTVHRWHRVLAGSESLRRPLLLAAQAVGVGLLALVVYRGITGPQVPTVNLAVVVIFAGVRAGLTMFAYLVGNLWPALNPWRAVAERLPGGVVDYPTRLGRWPAAAALLALVWLETTTGVTKQPDLLALGVAAYSVATLAGAVAVGAESWFRNVDPVSVVFRFYGRVAPLSWGDGGLRLSLPGMRLVGSDGYEDDSGDFVRGLDDVAVAVALVWELTYSGFVTTNRGAAVVTALVDVGLPALLVYAVLFVVGFAAFYGAYLLASRVAVRRIQTYREARELAVRFAPSLLAIAAGYHLAHYFGFFVSLTPSLVAVLASPLSAPPNPLVLTLPGWFGLLNIGFVLGGHLLAIWVAHSTAYRLFPSRMQAIRSQYPFVAVMMIYTGVSLWLISLPTQAPPFLP